MYPSVLQKVTEPVSGGIIPGAVGPSCEGTIVPMIYPPASSSAPIHQVTSPGLDDQSTVASASPTEILSILVVSGKVVAPV